VITINEEYDEVHANPFAGIAVWKMVTTKYEGTDVLRKDTLREQLINATKIPLMRAKDVPGWMNNIRSIFKEFVQAHGNTAASYVIADDLVMSKTLTILTQGAYAQGADIVDWHTISEVAKEIKNQRDSHKLAAKQFYILYDKVSKKTDTLFGGAQSSYNSLDPNGPEATDGSEAAFYCSSAILEIRYRSEAPSHDQGIHTRHFH
jgi:hypothetical protein